MRGRTGSLAVPARRWWAAQAASGGHAVPTRLPCTCMGASPASRVLFSAASAHVLPARGRAVATRATAASRTRRRSVATPRWLRAERATRAWGPGGRAVAPRPDSSARARGVSPALLVLFAAARARRLGGASFRIEPRAPASPAGHTSPSAPTSRGKRASGPSGHAVPARLPCTCTGASPALLAARARRSGARAMAARAGVASKAALARKRQRYPTMSSAAREAAFRIEPRGRTRGTRSSRPGASGRAVTVRPPDSRARARGRGRRCTCFSRPPARASRQPSAARHLRALAWFGRWRWHRTGAAGAIPRAGAFDKTPTSSSARFRTMAAGRPCADGRRRHQRRSEGQGE